MAPGCAPPGTEAVVVIPVAGVDGRAALPVVLPAQERPEAVPLLCRVAFLQEGKAKQAREPRQRPEQRLVAQHVRLEFVQGHRRGAEAAVRVAVVGDEMPGLAPGRNRREALWRNRSACGPTNRTLFNFAAANAARIASFSAIASAPRFTTSGPSSNVIASDGAAPGAPAVAASNAILNRATIGNATSMVSPAAAQLQARIRRQSSTVPHGKILLHERDEWIGARWPFGG